MNITVNKKTFSFLGMVKMFKGFWLFVVLLFSLQILQAQDLENIKNAKPFTINGNVGLNSVFYNASGIENRQSPFSYGLNANLNMSVYGVLELPFSFVWYNQQSSYNYPSFNSFGLSPKYKWITAHFGHRNMRLSEYTLNGHTFLGAGVELTPGKFRFAAMYGKFNQNSDNDPYMADSIPRFTRRGWAAKMGYGTEKSFVDVSMLRIGDDMQNYTPSMNPAAPTPMQNLAFGLTTKVAITPKLSFSFDGALSVITRNLSDSTDIKLTGFGTSLVQKMMTINTSSGYSTAFKTNIAYQFTDRLGAAFEYKRLDPDYESLGAYFFNNDLELYTISANAGLLKNKLMLRGSLGIQRDNLGNTKKATSGRTVGSLGANYNINQNWGIDVNYSNLSTNQRAGRSAIIDSLRLFQVNHNISVMPRFSKVTGNNSHFVMLNISRMQLDDKNKQTALQNETNTTILAPNYSLGFIKSRLNISLGVNHTTLTNNMYEGRMFSASLSAAKSVFKDKVALSWANSFMLNTMENKTDANIGSNDGTTFNSYLTANYRPHQKHSFNLGLNYISNKYKITDYSPSFNEIRGEIRYAYTF